MDKSIYTFQLAGKEIVLKFKWGNIHKLKNLLNADPFSEMSKSLDQTMNTVDFATNIIVTHGDISKEELDPLIDSELPGKVIDVATKVMVAFRNAFSIDEVGGETDNNTQQEQAA